MKRDLCAFLVGFNVACIPWAVTIGMPWGGHAFGIVAGIAGWWLWRR